MKTKKLFALLALPAMLICYTQQAIGQTSVLGNTLIAPTDFLGWNSNDPLTIRTRFTQPIIFELGGVGPLFERARIHTNGFMGIGITSPVRPLEVSNSSAPIPQLRLTVKFLPNTWTDFETTFAANLRINPTGRKVGINLITGPLDPQNTLEIDAGVPGLTGLRFRQMTGPPSPGPNPGTGVLALNALGDVIYVPAAGVDADWFKVGTTTPPTLFADNIYRLEKVTIGFNAAPSNSKLVVFNLTEEIAANFVTFGNLVPGLPTAVRAEVTGAIGVNFAVRARAFSNEPNAGTGGIFATAEGTGGYNVGVWGIGKNAATNAGAVFLSSGNGPAVVNYGSISEATGNSLINIGVWGEAPPFGFDRAGYFDGIVETNEFYIPSDDILKQNVQPIEDATGTLIQLNPVTFNFDTAGFPMNLPGNNQFGLLAQELEQVLPELVRNSLYAGRLDSAGNQVKPLVEYKSSNYIGLISILIKGFQEQQVLIDSIGEQLALCCPQGPVTICHNGNTMVVSQQALPAHLNHGDQLGPCQNNKTGETGNGTAPGELFEPEKEGSWLLQNQPNPFSENTTIHYSVPEGAGSSSIMVFDLQGKLMKTFDLHQKGRGQVTLSGGELYPGMFIYALVIDGQEVATKRMILTD